MNQIRLVADIREQYLILFLLSNFNVGFDVDSDTGEYFLFELPVSTTKLVNKEFKVALMLGRHH
jgi:hypothetical protein